MIDISEKQEHVTVEAEGSVHVIPMSLLRNIASGKKESLILTEPVVRAIIKDWIILNNQCY